MGYIGMWLSKLALTELLTDQPAIREAWKSVAVRLGFAGNRAGNADIYSPIKALRRIREVILPDQVSLVLFWVVLLGLVGMTGWKWSKKELNYTLAKNGAGILLLAIFPILWFVVTAQPIIIHAFFQYRSIVLLYWAVSAYLLLIMEKSAKTAVTENNPCEIHN